MVQGFKSEAAGEIRGEEIARTALEELAQIAQAIACCERCPLYISWNDAYNALIADLKRAKRLGEGERKAVKA